MFPMPLRSQTTTAFMMLSILRSSRPFAPAAPTVLRRKLTLLVSGLSRLEDDKALTTTSEYLMKAPWNGREGPGYRRASASFTKVNWMNKFHSSATRFQSMPLVSSSETVDQESADTIDQVPTNLFSGLELHKNTHAAISDVMGYQRMTKVQEQSIPVCLTGVDVLAKAKTGTGKTLAFLIPAIERAAAAADERKGKGISGIIISPTRELAQQIAVEAQQVMSFHRMKLMCFVGGTNINRDLNQLGSGAPDILVATPGRLVDLLENHRMGRLMKKLDTLILDEADQLLEMGFRSAIDTILRRLPSKMDRQTMLFSATMPGDVQAMASLALRAEYKTVDSVGEEEDTHQHVPQKFAIVPASELMPRLLVTLLKAREDPDHKIIVFFVAARVVQAYAELFNNMGIDVLETHSRKSQSARTRVSQAFRSSKGVIMFTSDVSARGMDYPDVSLVVQVGLPSDQNQYVHRLGRTARAGKGGRGLMLLADSEKGFLREVQHLPLEEDERVTPGDMAEARQRVADGKIHVADETIQMAYSAWLGFYKGNLKRMKWTPETLVQEANSWATRIWGLPSPPALTASTIGKMGLKGVRGLVVDSTPRTYTQGAGKRDARYQHGDWRTRGNALRQRPPERGSFTGRVETGYGDREIEGDFFIGPRGGRGTHGGARRRMTTRGRGARGRGRRS